MAEYIERPSWLFKPVLLGAIRRCDKTQTRRIPTKRNCLVNGDSVTEGPGWRWEWLRFDEAWPDLGPSPAGNPGPYLHVPHYEGGRFGDQDWRTVHRIYPRLQPGTTLYLKEGLHRKVDCVGYSDEMRAIDRRQVYQGSHVGWKWLRDTLTSVYMPRYAARDFLAVTDVRVERVRDITTADISAEGVDNGKSNPAMGHRHDAMQRIAWQKLWDSINGKKPGCSWADNPYVWAYTFTYTRDIGRAMP